MLMLTLDQSRPDLQDLKVSLENGLTDEAKWKAVLSRNHSCDGAFVFALRSTGSYCRPSCPAKRSNRDNAVFFAGRDEAERSGFRPCRRCSPRDVGPSSGAAGVCEICAFVDAYLGNRLTLSRRAAD